MQYTLLTTTLGLAALSSASAISDTKRDLSLLRLPVASAKHDLSERDPSADLDNFQRGLAYLVEISLGTPKQAISVQLSTGSSVFWVNPNCSDTSYSAQCKKEPRFNPEKSTTLEDNHSPMNLSGGGVLGAYYTDVVSTGNFAVEQQIGIAEDSTGYPFGILGVEPSDADHPTLIDNLAIQGYTRSRAFSIDLGSVDDSQGSIIFGGIDTGKYKGDLEKLPLIQNPLDPDDKYSYWIHMDSVGITKPGGQSKTYELSSKDPKGQPVSIKAGSTYSYLPAKISDQIAADFPGAKYLPDINVYEVDCALASQDGTVDFGFGKTVIHVPYSEIIFTPPGDRCFLGVGESVGDYAGLGNTFFKSAYAVFDQDQKNIFLAQAINCGTNLVEIGTGPDAVPSIAGGCQTSTTTSSTQTKTSTTTKTTSSTTTSTSSQVTSKPASSSPPASYPATSYPAASSPVSSYPVGNSNSTSSGYYSTVYSTTIYTISSCAPTVTDCPYGHKTTEVVSLYTTFCPESQGYPTGPPATYPAQPGYTATGTGAPVPSYTAGTATPLPPYTSSAGKAAGNMFTVIATVAAAMVAVAVL